MPKKYLQEKVIGSNGQYMAIQNGIPVGINAMFGVSPTIEVIAPSDTGRIVCAKDLVILEVEPIPIIGSQNSKWIFAPTSYGVWTISAVQTDGSSNTYLFADSIDVVEVTTYTLEISSDDFISSTLSDNSWTKIKKVAQSMCGSSYWSIGDTKGVTVSNKGTIIGLATGNTLTNGTHLACIIGFNHNTDLEGSGLIHFQLFCLDTAVTTTTSPAITTKNMAWFGFKYNDTNTVAGGWESSYLRNTMFGIYLNQTNCLLNCLGRDQGSDFRDAIAPVIKYTDNVGDGTSYDRNISQTIDYLFQPSVKEVFGDISFNNINPHEKNYQQQYEYYKDSANRRRARPSSVGSTTYYEAHTFLRSVSLDGNILEIRDSNTIIYTEDENTGATTVRNACPCFCIGKNSLLS